jgi:hypothetical protein
MTRTARFFIRLSPEEKSALFARASQYSGYSAATFAREMLLTGRVEPILSVNLQQWTKLGGIANNLNQLTRLSHASGTITPELEQMLQELSLTVTAIRHDLITKQAARD